MKSVLVFHHVAHEMLGTIRLALTRAGLSVHTLDLFAAEPPEPPDLDKAAGLIILGGPMNVDEVDRYPFLRDELDWIRQALAKDRPILGVCLGAQLLAKALGARVRRNPCKEIGWYPLELLDAAASDPLFRACWQTADTENGRRQITVFQWHGDTFDLPDGAVPLARSELCANQAFRYGKRAWGLQFHAEMTRDMIAQWLEEPGNCDELAELDYIDPEAIRQHIDQELPALQLVAKGLFGAFAALCRS